MGMNGNGNRDHGQQVSPTFLFSVFILFFNLLFDYDRVPTLSQMATDKLTATNRDKREWERGPRAAGASTFLLFLFSLFFNLLFDCDRVLTLSQMAMDMLRATNEHEQEQE
jgi:hypothetical protein